MGSRLASCRAAIMALNAIIDKRGVVRNAIGDYPSIGVMAGIALGASDNMVVRFALRESTIVTTAAATNHFLMVDLTG